ncbi:MAG: molybdopterin-dependent oxidoreductase [Eggerthellaceae bacterium]|nr:molybdopterin-dependent oxidoreductase [Eggerthellaceae bacterium]
MALAGGMFGKVVPRFVAKTPEAVADSKERIVWNHCAINCPGRCSLKLHVKDDEIVQVETYAVDDDDIDSVQPRACLRGRSYRAWVYDPNRINYPLKRAEGTKRGEGKFTQISWDEAIELVSSNLKRVISQYGNEAVYINYATGVSSSTGRSWPRLLNILGGYLGYYGTYSTAEINWITPYIYGSSGAGSTISAAAEAALVLVFGSSPCETRQGGAVSNHDYVAMREKTKGKVYVFDYRYSDSMMGHSDTWVPINPGTDAALVSALAYELISTNLVDLDFLHTYCQGFDEETMPESAQGKNLSYKDYIMGTGYDRIAKTPEWAEPITGIPANRIRELAHEIGTAKPLYVVQGWGSQRRSNGELTAWAICMLPLLTGQIGLPGTNNGLREGSYAINLDTIPAGNNPVKTQISVFSMVDAIERGPEMTEMRDGVKNAEKLEVGIKFVVNYAGNCITNQNSDINWVHDIMADDTKCEFVVGSDIVMCDSMKYCDVILPDIFRLEQESMIGTGGDSAYMIAGSRPYGQKHERKSAYEAISLIAKALGVERDFTEGKTEGDWIKDLYEAARSKDDTLPTLTAAREMGVFCRKNPKGHTIALEAYRKDPVGKALSTMSGKIDIYSEELADYIAAHEFLPDDRVTAIPTYVPEWYGVETTTDQYPLALSGFHYRGRIHSSWGGVELLKELNPQELWINPADAGPRGIESGDTVRASNEFGAMELLARVTPRIVPGTVAAPQGAWHDADMNGDRIDRGGNYNTLATHRPSPFAKGNPQHTNICQVEKTG